ncbi:MAG: DUF4276 family protein [Rhodothermales bacterium]
MALEIYIEGGGSTKTQQTRLRIGMGKLLNKTVPQKKRVRPIACGSRDQAYKRFKSALESDQNALLLVDSEDVISEGMTRWTHLKKRDKWSRPHGATEDDVHFMAACMETWIATDRDALRKYFGSCLREKALPPVVNMERRLRKDLLRQLENATNNCSKVYSKGDHSFKLVGALNPEMLRAHLPHFVEFEKELKKR